MEKKLKGRSPPSRQALSISIGYAVLAAVYPIILAVLFSSSGTHSFTQLRQWISLLGSTFPTLIALFLLHCAMSAATLHFDRHKTGFRRIVFAAAGLLTLFSVVGALSVAWAILHGRLEFVDSSSAMLSRVLMVVCYGVLFGQLMRVQVAIKSAF